GRGGWHSCRSRSGSIIVHFGSSWVHRRKAMPLVSLLVHGALLGRLLAPAYPFAVGERLQYEAKLGMLPIGTAVIAVNPMTREGGREAFVFAATGQGRPLGIRVGAELTSYVGARGFNSLRFHRRV